MLILLAFLIVILIEIRTVLAFFGVDIGPEAVVVLGIVSITALLVWALSPSDGDEPS